MSNDKTTLADVQPGGRVRLGDSLPPLPEPSVTGYGFDSVLRRIPMPGFTAEQMRDYARAALSAQPSPGGQDALASELLAHAEGLERMAADDRETGLSIEQAIEDGEGYTPDEAADIAAGLQHDAERGEETAALLRKAATALAARQPVERSFQAGVAEWMGRCFLPSLYSNMTERGDRLLEEVLELLQAHGYDSARVPTLVDYVFGRPVGEPAQEVGGVMVTLAGYCWVAGLDMHAAGDAELARISQPEVMAKIRAKQEAKNALHFDTPLPGNAAAPTAQAVDLGQLQRFDVFADEGPGLGGMSVDYEEAATGTWVRFDDVKALIESRDSRNG